MNRKRYDVYFLGTDGLWRLQHTFTWEDNAIACAKNLSRTVTATVNEVEWCSRTNRILSETQIFEAACKGAA